MTDKNAHTPTGSRKKRYTGGDLGALLKAARLDQRLSQGQVVEKMHENGARGTQASVSDAERHGPQILSVAQKHAAALGLRIVFRLEPMSPSEGT